MSGSPGRRRSRRLNRFVTHCGIHYLRGSGTTCKLAPEIERFQ